MDLVRRRSYRPEIVAAVDSLQFAGFSRTGDHTYRFTTDDAREIARLFDQIEQIVLH